jgi:hypothetical protein
MPIARTGGDPDVTDGAEIHSCPAYSRGLASWLKRAQDTARVVHVVARRL